LRVRAKANVLQNVGFACRVEALLILRSVGILSFIFSVYLLSALFFLRVKHNGPRIGDSGGLESQYFQISTYLCNSLLLFSKFMKKGNIKGCCDK